MDNIYHLDFLAKEKQQRILNTFGIMATTYPYDQPKQNLKKQFVLNFGKTLKRVQKKSSYNLKRILISGSGA